MSSLQLKMRSRDGRLRPVAAVVPAIAALVVLAACSSSSSSSSSSPSGSSAASSASQASSGGKTVSIVVIGGATNDPFWSTVKRGGEAAAAAVASGGGKVTFLALQNYNNFGPDSAKLEEDALALNPSAVVVADWTPSAQNAAIEQMVSKGIPVFIYNSGETEVATVGAHAYIGSDDYVAGKAGGVEFATAGVKDILCVNTNPGTINEEARCKGIKDGAAEKGATSTELELPTSQFGDPTAVSQAIKAALLKNSSIDGVVTIGAADSDSAASAIQQAGASSRVQLGSFDVSTSELNRINAGTQLFAIDQQPYAQGYYAVSEAFQYVAYGINMPDEPLLTGPALITKQNVTSAIAGAALGVR